ncbi:hypothetical protein [Kitasatospora sp. NPDC094016]|uniref:hypothetical protein n=1 Tax=Kitasatospora sp. NPDC094016 TaxID=3154986 RepID=UPI003327076A
MDANSGHDERFPAVLYRYDIGELMMPAIARPEWLFRDGNKPRTSHESLLRRVFS